ncbi:MAG: hypothetical protein IT348_16960 [Candidatus Eisenbacteria bacterium]|nr:hypothetical protein [Candidatus Eisenbacteria bacterium]
MKRKRAGSAQSKPTATHQPPNKQPMSEVPTVYLDCSDFSRLSDARRLTIDLRALRGELLALSHSGAAMFVFSMVHICEMSPLEASSADHASARADFLSDLCGRNALVSFDQLLLSEVERLAHLEPTPVHAITTDATWFPPTSGFISPARALEGFQLTLDAKLQAHGMNHAARRVMMRRAFKNGSLRLEMRQMLIREGLFGALDEVFEQYPMRPQDASVLWRYVMGLATCEAAEAAFLASLRDPRWMMRWFKGHHARLSPLVTWLREPSAALAERIAQVIMPAQRVLRSAQRPDVAQQLRSELLVRWDEMREQILVAVANAVRRISLPDSPDVTEARLVAARCPGLTAMVDSVMLAARDALGQHPRELTANDVRDAMHAVYAPYVSVFRADRYMAQHVRRATAGRGVIVASTLEELPMLLNHMGRSPARTA